MCELFAMSALLPTTVDVSLEEFARHGGGTAANADGWGIAYYEGGDIRRIRDPQPAHDSPWVRFLNTLHLQSTLVISHVRYATRGPVVLRNTHPFCRELDGRVHVFAHNGSLPGIDRVSDLGNASNRPVGETDSERAFCILLERFRANSETQREMTDLEVRMRVFRGFAAEMRGLGPANFLYADGEVLFVHGHQRKQADGTIRPPGLHLLARSCPCDRDAISTQGLTVGGEGQKVVLVASVPLSDEDWRPLRPGETLAIAKGEIVSSEMC